MSAVARRVETQHEAFCRSLGWTPDQVNETQRRMARFLWAIVAHALGFAFGCSAWGHGRWALAALIGAVALAVFLLTARGEFDPVTGKRVHRARPMDPGQWSR